MSKVAFIVGNGITRKEINLDSLVGKAPIYGCNALYRDFKSWDYLVAIDDGMIKELGSLDHDPKKKIVIPELDRRFESAEYSPTRRRNNAGMIAMEEAISNGASILYCIGFDFIMGNKSSTDNVYKNSRNYGPETHANQNDNFYRLRYLDWFARQHPNVKFVFVRPEGYKTHRVFSENVVLMDTEVFVNKATA